MSNNSTNQREANCPIVGSKRSQLLMGVFITKFDLYAASRDGQIIHIIKQAPSNGCEHCTGYLHYTVRKCGHKIQKGYFIHRFVWECFHGVITDDKVIDHIKDDNHKNRRYVKATNINTEEVSYLSSMYAVQQHLGINAGIIKWCVRGLIIVKPAFL